MLKWSIQQEGITIANNMHPQWAPKHIKQY